MRSVLLLALTTCLVASGLPLTAQERTETGGPLAKGGTFSRSDWARVVAIASDTDVVVTVQGSKPVRRRIVYADEFTLTVMNPRTHVAEAIARAGVLEIRMGERRLSGRRRALARIIHEEADFVRDTKASAWYKAVATRAFSHDGGF